MDKESDAVVVAQIVIWSTICLGCFLFGIDYWRSKKKTVNLSITDYYVTSGWLGGKKILASTNRGKILVPMDVYENRNREKINLDRIVCTYDEGRITQMWYNQRITKASFKNKK